MVILKVAMVCLIVVVDLKGELGFVRGTDEGQYVVRGLLWEYVWTLGD